MRSFAQAKQIEQMIAAETSVAASVVDDLIFRYGALEAQDMEREILLQKIRSVLSAWAETVMALGGIPGDLWTVQIEFAGGVLSWQYPCSRLVPGDSPA